MFRGLGQHHTDANTNLVELDRWKRFPDGVGRDIHSAPSAVENEDVLPSLPELGH